MSLFLGPMSRHIPGHKSMTEHEPILELMPAKEVFIPLAAGANTDFECFVEAGQHVDKGQKIAQTKSGFFVPIYASVSGTCKGIVKRMHSSVRPVPHLVIEMDGKQSVVQSFEPMDWQKADREALVEFTKQAGLVGLGGAGFPTYVKYGNVANIHTLIINAVECEPYITSDYKLVMDEPERLIEGVQILRKMADCQRAVIAIKKSHPEMIAAVQAAAAGTGIEVQAVPDVYPMGWERVLVRELLHTEYDKLPSEAGAIVNNAGTAIELAGMMKTGMGLTYKLVTVSGQGIARPVNVKVPVGMPVREILEACGGVTGEEALLIAGGPMMGRTIPNDLFVIDRAMNALTVLPTYKDDAIACLRCGSCSDHCPAGLQPVRIQNLTSTGNVELLEKLGTLSCIECGLCTYVCPSHIQVTENVRKAKRMIQMKKKK